MEWIVGNTFPFIVFASYGKQLSCGLGNVKAHGDSGAFWIALGATFQPDFNALGAYVNPADAASTQAAGQIEYYNTYGKCL